MSNLRVSEIHVQVIMLDEFDAIVPGDPQPPFKGNPNGSSVDNLIAWLNDMNTHLEKASIALDKSRGMIVVDSISLEDDGFAPDGTVGDGNDTKED